MGGGLTWKQKYAIVLQTGGTGSIQGKENLTPQVGAG